MRFASSGFYCESFIATNLKVGVFAKKAKRSLYAGRLLISVRVEPLRNHLWSSLQAFPSPSQRPSPVCSGQMSMRSASRAQMLQTMRICCCRCRQRMSSLQGLRDVEVGLSSRMEMLDDFQSSTWKSQRCTCVVTSSALPSFSVTVGCRRRLNDTCSAEFQVLKCQLGSKRTQTRWFKMRLVEGCEFACVDDEGTSDPFVLVMLSR